MLYFGGRRAFKIRRPELFFESAVPMLKPTGVVAEGVAAPKPPPPNDAGVDPEVEPNPNPGVEAGRLLLGGIPKLPVAGVVGGAPNIKPDAAGVKGAAAGVKGAAARAKGAATGVKPVAAG